MDSRTIQPTGNLNSRSGVNRFMRTAMFAMVLVACLWISAIGQSSTSPVHSTPMEEALDQLRLRFPEQVAVGFEELWDKRPASQPHLDLGSPNVTLSEALERIRRAIPEYKLDLLPGGVVHVYPAHGTADPKHLLDIRLREFALPPEGCIPQQINHMDTIGASYSYTPELSVYLWRKKQAWYRQHQRSIPGTVGDLLGDCGRSRHQFLTSRIRKTLTVREALNAMANRSLAKVASKSTPEGTKPISWRYRFRRDPRADTGLGGYTIFQTF